VDQGLKELREKLELSGAWVQAGIQKLDSRDLAKLPSNEMADHIESMAMEKKQQDKALADLKALADHLVKDPRTGDTAAVQEAVTDLQRQIDALESLLAAKQQEAQAKEKQLGAFENARTLALLWLSQMEARLDEFQPVAIEVDMVETQIAELQVGQTDIFLSLFNSNQDSFYLITLYSYCSIFFPLFL
jgi:Tfp pilus assembly protein FimV